MVKKVRLLNEEETETTETTETAQSSNIDADALMKYLEAIDWKLWEMLKLFRKQDEEARK